MRIATNNNKKIHLKVSFAVIILMVVYVGFSIIGPAVLFTKSAVAVAPASSDDVKIYEALRGFLNRCTDNGQVYLEPEITGKQFADAGYSPIQSAYSKNTYEVPTTLFKTGTITCTEGLYWATRYMYKSDTAASRTKFIETHYDTTHGIPYAIHSKDGVYTPFTTVFNDIKTAADGIKQGKEASFSWWRDRIINQAFTDCYEWGDTANPLNKDTPDSKKYDPNNWVNHGPDKKKRVGYMAELAIEGRYDDGVIGCEGAKSYVLENADHHYILDFGDTTLDSKLDDASTKAEKQMKKDNVMGIFLGSGTEGLQFCSVASGMLPSADTHFGVEYLEYIAGWLADGGKNPYKNLFSNQVTLKDGTKINHDKSTTDEGNPGAQATFDEFKYCMKQAYPGLEKALDVKIKAPVSTIESSNSGGSGSDKDDKSCESVGGWAWALCPAVEAISGAGNVLTRQISNLLEADRDKYTNPELYKVWVNIRNIALAGLVVIMMVMVIATALNTQMFDAYTVKRALPRMVAAVIFIILSWYICIFLVDVFNAMGRGVLGIMSAPFGGKLDLANVFDVGIGTFVTNLLASGALIIGLLLVAIFFGFTIFMFILVAFLVLVLRQLFILALIILAPLAILAWIFPGNDKLWKLWWSSFSKLLMMYPLIMAMLGAGRVFAALSGGSAGGSAGAQGAILDPIIQLAAYTLPFAFIPFTFKTAGGLFGSLAGMANDKSKGVFDRAKKRRGEKAQRFMQGNAFKSAPEGSRRARINTGIQAASSIKDAGFRPSRMRTNVRTAMLNHEEADVKNVMEDTDFTAWSGDDAKVSAAQFTSHDDIATELARFDNNRFGGEENRQAREDAISQIVRSQRKHNNGSFQRARVRAMSKTGTGYQYTDANGQTQIDTSRMIDDINSAYGDDRNGAGKALAEMRNNLAQSGHIAGMAGYGTWAGQMEGMHRGTITAQDAHEAIMDDTIDSVSPGQAIYGKPASAAAVGAAHRRRIQGIAAGISAGTHTQDDLSAALAGAAGIYDAMSQASPQNASAMANELMSEQINLPGQTLSDGRGGTVSIDGLSVRELLQTQMAGNPEFANRRRDLTQATLAQAQALAAGATGAGGVAPMGPMGPPPTGPPPSDIRLKHDINYLGANSFGIKLYSFKYIWTETVYVGVMAQEIIKTHPWAVSKGSDGYYRVNYSSLDIQMMTLSEWNQKSIKEVQKLKS